MKKILAVCIVLGFLVWYFTNTGKQQPVTGDAVHITMGQDEYEPSEVTIKKGTTVVFTNKSPDWRWPASNLHPTHDIYPEFDPKEPVAPEGSWSFQFDKSGSWRMHDHLAPYITGTITVEE